MGSETSYLPVTAAWAKAGNASEPVPHPLVCHLIDTAAVAHELYEVLLGPSVRTQLEAGLRPLGRPRSVVAVLCGLHDLGKLSPAFQALRYDIAVARFPETKNFRNALFYAEKRHRATPERTDLPHGVATAAHMANRFRRMGVAGETADEIASVVGGHHGTLPQRAEIRAAQRKAGDLGTGPWQVARDELMDTVASLWDCTFPATGCTDVALPHPAGVGLAGLTTISDWIASNQRWFEAHPDVSDLAEYQAKAVATAQQAITELGWQPWRPTDVSCAGMFPEPAPNSLQRTVEELVADCDSPGILTIEAPTGEGKTRAALQAAATLVQRLGLSGMYMGMPTKATSRQTRGEIDALLTRQGSSLRSNPVYSGATAERSPHGPRIEVREVGVDEPSRESDSVSADSSAEPDSETGSNEVHEWFAKKRGLAAPIGVGTIDQALQAVIRSRHNFLRMSCLSGKVLVVDEVHSYETYTSTLLDRLLWWCGRLGITVVLLSATLASTRRDELIGRWQSGHNNPTSEPEELTATQPGEWQVTWADGAGRRPPREFGVSEQNPLVLNWIHEHSEPSRDDSDNLVDWLRENIESEGCAAIIHNTVARAKRTFETLQTECADWEEPPELFFLTGQLDAGDRAEREQILQDRFGAKGERRSGIVVGTQVLEQSLDLDFDIMITDPCPIDLLLQRAGRLHRHSRSARPVPERMLGVIDPRPPANARQKVERKYRFPESAVYRQYLKISTIEAVSANMTLDMPTVVPKLVQEVYVEDVRPNEEARYEQWDESRKRYERADRVDIHEGEVAALPMSIPGQSLNEFTRHTTNPSRTRKERGRKEQQP
ncbi:CRISPR-associated endonuclease/helicase Cas3 [Actinopolyspora lacussalsi subsp. righensis]|uniref:CRISPR-associated endonuclease/helicase Cas3 n=1 Tax=Actinopolyspora righensis TaxID=995060 RepID=A0A1I6XG97_9ACTN|nr:CRISPR-associated helicase/endonuclease Cas3 [Actinopolyspora righensis]SFT37012.1 CRISPR-associated endonuclease/helicase Cas3 [Actinopolyspora righensis]